MKDPVLFAECVALISLLGVVCAVAADDSLVPPLQSANTMKAVLQIPVSIDYLLYLPEAYPASTEPWPLIMFLHGAGERGSDLAKVRKHGPAKLIDAGKRFPFIIVSPQCPANGWWTSELQLRSLVALLADLQRRYRIDEDRVYLTGLSMGGYGTWALAGARPDLFAAAAPVCGGGMPERVGSMRDVPTWAFHGVKDQTVSPDESRKMVAALKKAGGNVKLTLYPDAGHDAWTATYRNPALYEWFLSHRRP